MVCSTGVNNMTARRYTLTYLFTHIGPVMIWSQAPITIQVYPQSGAAVLELSKPLEPTFADGWNRFPDELKLRVLSNLLILDHNIDRHDPFIDPKSPERSLYSYLRMTPDIARLAKEIFYTKNIFFLEAHTDDFGGFDGHIQHKGYVYREFYARPNLATALFIRELEINIRLTNEEWSDLARIANGAYGFQNLRMVRLTIDLDHAGIKDEDEVLYTILEAGNLVEDLDQIIFSCKGSIEYELSEFDLINNDELICIVEGLVHFDEYED
jgi:hypothetical protein